MSAWYYCSFLFKKNINSELHKDYYCQYDKIMGIVKAEK